MGISRLWKWFNKCGSRGQLQGLLSPTPPMVLLTQGSQSPGLAAAASLSFHSRSCWIWFPSFGASKGVSWPWPWNTIKMHWKHPKMHWNTPVNAFKCPDKCIIHVWLSRKQQPPQKKCFSGNKATTQRITWMKFPTSAHPFPNVNPHPRAWLQQLHLPSSSQEKWCWMNPSAAGGLGLVLLPCAPLSIQQTGTQEWFISKWEEEKRRNSSPGVAFEQIGNIKQIKSGRKSWVSMP